MQKVICDLCGADAPDILFSKEDRYTGESFQFATCTNCGLIYLPSRPSTEDIAKYYPADYEAFYLIDYKMDDRQQWHLRRALSLQLDFVEKHSSSKGKLLDIGCATGNFLKFAKDRDWQVLGIEPINDAARIARDYYQLDVITGTLDTISLAGETYDVITMWDVLEHLPTPKSTISQCHRLLKNDGILVFSIPNLHSFDRYLFGRNWIGWDAPRHFNLFTGRSLIRLLNTTGFDLVDKRCILGGKGAFLLSLDQVFSSNRSKSRIRSTYPIISAFLWPYRQISYLLNRGPIITYAVRKSNYPKD